MNDLVKSELDEICLYYNNSRLSEGVRKHFMELYGSLVKICGLNFGENIELYRPYEAQSREDQEALRCKHCDLLVRYCDSTVYSGANGTSDGCDLGRGLVTFHIREHTKEGCQYQRVIVVRAKESNQVTPSALTGLFSEPKALRKAENEACLVLAHFRGAEKVIEKERMTEALLGALLRSSQAGFEYLKNLPDKSVLEVVMQLAEDNGLLSKDQMALIVSNAPMPMGEGKVTQARTVKGGSRYHIRGGSGPNTLTSATPLDRAALMIDAHVHIVPSHLARGGFDVPEPVSDAGKSVSKAAKDAATWLEVNAKKAGKSVGDFWNDLVAKVNGSKVGEAGTSAVESAKDLTKSASKSAKDLAESASKSAKDLAESASKGAKDLADKSGANEILDTASERLQGFAESVKRALTQGKDTMVPVTEQVAVVVGTSTAVQSEIPVTTTSATSAAKDKSEKKVPESASKPLTPAASEKKVPAKEENPSSSKVKGGSRDSESSSHRSSDSRKTRSSSRRSEISDTPRSASSTSSRRSALSEYSAVSLTSDK